MARSWLLARVNLSAPELSGFVLRCARGPHGLAARGSPASIPLLSLSRLARDRGRAGLGGYCSRGVW
jgi:hypothetical protein